MSSFEVTPISVIKEPDHNLLMQINNIGHSGGLIATKKKKSTKSKISADICKIGEVNEYESEEDKNIPIVNDNNPVSTYNTAETMLSNEKILISEKNKFKTNEIEHQTNHEVVAYENAKKNNSNSSIENNCIIVQEPKKISISELDKYKIDSSTMSHNSNITKINNLKPQNRNNKQLFNVNEFDYEGVTKYLGYLKELSIQSNLYDIAFSDFLKCFDNINDLDFNEANLTKDFLINVTFDIIEQHSYFTINSIIKQAILDIFNFTLGI